MKLDLTIDETNIVLFLLGNLQAKIKAQAAPQLAELQKQAETQEAENGTE